MKKKDPCKAFACRIQDCLERNNFQESSCVHVIEDMKNCCRTWGERSFVCNGIKTDDTPKITNRKQTNYDEKTTTV